MRDDLKSKGVKYCIGAFVDIHGVPKGKFVPIDHFEDFAAGSELYTGYALDGVGQRPNDDEIASLPDLTRGCILPWNKEVAWFPADNTFKGQPYEVSTRVALQEATRRSRGNGIRHEPRHRVRTLCRETRRRRHPANPQPRRRPRQGLLRRQTFPRPLHLARQGLHRPSTTSAGTSIRSTTRTPTPSSSSISNTPTPSPCATATSSSA